MSYSLKVKAESKAKAIEAVGEEFSKVVAAQPAHEKDREQASAAARSMVELLAEDGDKDVLVAVEGYLSWHGDADARRIQTVHVRVTASLESR